MLAQLSATLCPAPLPALSGNIYCVGRNYAEHAKELQNELPSEPVIFLKAPSALRPLAAGPLAFATESFHHEIELVLLLGKDLPLGSTADLSVIQGISLGIDLTRRAVQDQLKKKGLPWTIAKSFAGAALIHPFQAVSAPLWNQTIDFSLEINGERRQEGRSSDMIFAFAPILNYLLQHQPLFAGDIVFTGTPSGVGPCQRGDQLRVASKALAIDAKGLL
jgi:2-keto-4-pentenoate hydratase/2-oxohepta-3-ene-1,7-dioic acid hydratase in catechol pathway